VWVKDSERHASMMDKAQSDSKKVRELTKSDSNQHGKSDFRACSNCLDSLNDFPSVKLLFLSLSLCYC